MSTFKPMKAATWLPTTQAKFPYLVSPKFDGIRCMIIDGVAYSNNLKPIRNAHIQRTLGNKALNGLDGELIVGDPTGPGVFTRTTSGVMSADGEPEFVFHVFDCFRQPARDFAYRLGMAEDVCDDYGEILPLHHTTHTLVNNEDQLAFEELECLRRGYEGIMLRCPNGPYKYGRSTPLENWLWKVKRFRDAEARIVGLEEACENTNEAKTDELGRTKRSAHKAGKVPKGMVGTYIGEDLQTGQTIRIGAGCISHADRTAHWVNPQLVVGKLYARYKVFDYGSKDVPRFALCTGLRHPSDLSTED